MLQNDNVRFYIYHFCLFRSSCCRVVLDENDEYNDAVSRSSQARGFSFASRFVSRALVSSYAENAEVDVSSALEIARNEISSKTAKLERESERERERKK